MIRIAITRQLAWAASTDAGNRAMREAGRKAWSVEDYNVAIAEFYRLWPLELDLPAIPVERAA